MEKAYHVSIELVHEHWNCDERLPRRCSLGSQRSSIIHRFPHSISTNILTSSYGAILEQEMRNKISRLHTCVCSNFFSKGQMKWAHPFSIWIFVIYTGHDESSIFLLGDPSQGIVTFLMSRCIPHVHEFYPPNCFVSLEYSQQFTLNDGVHSYFPQYI